MTLRPLREPTRRRVPAHRARLGIAIGRVGILLGAAALASTALALGSAQSDAHADATTTSPSTHYVDCSGRTNGTGSYSAPWNSIGAVNRHGAFQPGDKILFKRGKTCRGRLLPTGSGSRGKPILIGAYSSGSRPTIAAGGSANTSAALALVNPHDWTVQDLHLINSSSAKSTLSYRSGLLILNTGVGRLSGITVQRLNIDHVTSNLGFSKGDAREWGGITVLTQAPRGAKKDSGFRGMRILGNRIDHVGRTGIVVSNHGRGVYDTDLRIGYNTVSWSRGDSIVVRGVDHARIDHNVSAHGAALWPCAQCGKITPYTANAAIWPAASRNVVIEYNEVYGEHVKGGDGEAFDIDALTTNVTLQYNYAHDNEGGGVLFCGSRNATVRFNILENNGKSAFAFIGNYPAHSSSIYNNTIYQSGKANATNIVRTFNGRHGSRISFFNNLVYNYGSGHYTWPTSVSSRSNTYVGLHTWNGPQGSGTSHSDPGLVRAGSGGKGFRSLGGYRQRHAWNSSGGSKIPRSVTRDIFGKRINSSKPPRGAAA